MVGKSKKIKTKKDSQIDERPLDPTRNAEDLIGDSSGMTGITTGSPKQTSAEPTDKAQLQNTAHLPGGIKDYPGETKKGTPADATNAKLYNEEVEEGMSDTNKAKAEELASGRENVTVGDQSATATDTAPAREKQDVPGNYSRNPTQASESLIGGQIDKTDKSQPFAEVPSSQGEESVSGDMPDPESDDDTLSNAQQAGSQVDEDPEHPEELDVGRDVDKAEEWHREH